MMAQISKKDWTDFPDFSIHSIHDDISLIRFVIPGLTEPAPYLIRGNPVFFWIPAGVYPVEKQGRNDGLCCD
jgi:hypothetical protein